jgi:hypothetical protein
MPTRRGFVTSTLGAGAVLATQGPHKAAGQADRRLIVDAQVHLWKAESPDWKWVPGLKPQLPEPFTIERLVPMMDEAGVDRAVIVPPSWPGDRNDYALEAVKRYPTRFRVMGRIPLQDPKSADLLPKWKEQQGMLGVRVSFNNAHGRHGELVLGSGRKGRASRHVFRAGPGRAARPHCRAASTAHIDPRPHGRDGGLVKDNKVEEAIGQTVASASRYRPHLAFRASPIRSGTSRCT